jgi:5-methylcytosine-specific restriction endonuclease McrA
MCVVRKRSCSNGKIPRRSATLTKSNAPAAFHNITSKLPGPSNQRQQVIRKAPAVGSRFMDDLPSKSQIVDHWKDRLPGLGITIDWGRPGCWACGFHYGARYRIKRSDTGWHEILSCWDNIPLQRCHIVSRSLGGTNKEANLFLMCRECHDLAPNTSILEIFFEWARAQDWDVRESARIFAALESFGVHSTDYQDFNEVILSDDFALWMSTKFGLHRPQSNYASVSSRLTPATLVGLAVHYRRLSRTADGFSLGVDRAVTTLTSQSHPAT